MARPGAAYSLGMRNLVAVLVLACGCSGSPLVDSGPQVELTSNPGGVAGHPRFQLTLTTWNNLHELGDAANSGQLEATLDGTPLVLDPGATAYVGNGGSFIAAFGLPPDATFASTATSTVTVTDQQTTWTVEIPALFTRDLQLVGPMVASQANTAMWPSAATSEPWSTIDFACIDVADHGAACHSDTAQDPGIDIAKQYVQIDVPAQAGDHFTLWGARWFHPQASGDGPIFFTTILDQVTGTYD